MLVDDMRAAITSVYPNATWKYRVDRMGDSQVIAIYYKFEAEGKFDKKKKDETEFTSFGVKAKQLTIEEFI